jgi:hypothetical protein
VSSVWSPRWRWVLRISWTLAHTWGLLSSRLPGPIGGIVAAPLALLNLPFVLAARASRTLAAVSPHAALLAVPVRPVRARFAHRLLGLVMTISIMVIVTAISIPVLVVDILVLDDGPLSTIYWTVLLMVALVGLVDGIGMFAGAREAFGLSALLAVRYPTRSVVLLGTFGAWPRHQGHGRQLITACAADLRRDPHWDVVVAGAVTDDLAALYQRLGLTMISSATRGPRRILAADLRPDSATSPEPPRITT